MAWMIGNARTNLDRVDVSRLRIGSPQHGRFDDEARDDTERYRLQAGGWRAYAASATFGCFSGLSRDGALVPCAGGEPSPKAYSLVRAVWLRLAVPLKPLFHAPVLT